MKLFIENGTKVNETVVALIFMGVLWIFIYLGIKVSVQFMFFGLLPIVFLVILIRADWILYIVTLNLLALRWLSSSIYAVPSIVPAFISEFCIFILIIRFLIKHKQSDKLEDIKAIPTIKLINLIFILTLLIYGLIGWVINQYSFMYYLVGIRNVIKYPILFYLILLNNFPVKIIQKNLKFFYIFMVIQIPVTVIQYYLYVVWKIIAIPDVKIGAYTVSRTMGDFIVGTLGYGQTGTLAVLMVLSIVYILMKIAEKRHQKSNITNYILIIGFCIPSILADAKSFIFLLLIAVIYYVFIISRLTTIKKICYSCLFLGIFISFTMFVGNYANQGYTGNITSNVGKFFNVQIENDKVILGRFSSLAYVLSFLSANNSLIFGEGVGTTYNGGMGLEPGKFYFSDNRIGLTFQQSSAILLEWGILGSVLWIGFLMINMMVVRKAVAKGLILKDMYVEIFFIVEILFLVCYFYTKVFSNEVLMYFYTLLYSYILLRKQQIFGQAAKTK